MGYEFGGGDIVECVCCGEFFVVLFCLDGLDFVVEEIFGSCVVDGFVVGWEWYLFEVGIVLFECVLDGVVV